MSGADVIGKTIAAPGFQVAPPPGFSGLQQAGDAIASYGEAMGKARDQSQLVDARLKYSTQLDDLYQGFMRDPDPATAPVRFAKAAQEASASYFDGLTSDEAKNAFNLDAGQLAESRRISLMDLSFKREGDQAVANVEAAGEKFARDAAYATNPAEREAAIASYTRSLMGTADAGFMTHDAAGKRLQTFKEKLSLFDGRVLIDQDPKLARTRLADPKFLPDLDPLARVELDGMAEAKIHQREREARADQAEARASAAAAIADYDSVVGSGLPVSPALTDQVKAAVRASGDPRLAARLENSMRAASFADGLRGASPREVEARLAAATNLAYATGAPMYTAGKPAGLVTQGNIDLSARPVVHNQDGTISTVRSITVQDGDHAVVLPTVSPDGKILSNQDAIKLYRQSGQHLGIFKNEAQATAYAKSLHEQQAAAYGAGGQVRGADPALAAAVVGGRKFLDRMNTQLGQDPLEFAAQQGVVRIQPLQLNGQDAPAAWQSRIRAADLTADHYGVQPHYLTAAEANQVKTNLAANADPAVRLATLQSLVKGLGSRAIPELNRLGASPALVTAGGLLTAGPAHARTAFDIVNGEAALAASSKGGDGQSALRPQPNARALATVIGVSTELAELGDPLQQAVGYTASVLSIALTCLALCWVLYSARWVSRLLGDEGINVVTRLTGFLLICIGIQFIGSGVRSFIAGT